MVYAKVGMASLTASSIGLDFVDEVSVACCSTRFALASSRSVSGLSTSWCTVKRLRADIGGQFRMTTRSSVRSSAGDRLKKTHRRRELYVLTVLLVVNQKLLAPHNTLESSWLMRRCVRSRDAYLAGKLVVDETGNRDCDRLVHKASLGHDSVECHRRHAGDN
jgi:hypothetical protein